jgi:hypothetical protein
MAKSLRAYVRRLVKESGIRPRANRDGTPQRGVGTVRLNYPKEDNNMSSNPPEVAAKTKREQRQRSIRLIVGLFMLMLGVPPLLNALNNPRVQALHTPDVLGFMASGLCIGFGLGLLLSKPLFRGG